MVTRIYTAVIICISIAMVTHFAGPSIAAKMAISASSHSNQQDRLKSFYQSSIFLPLARPSYPAPAASMQFIGLSITAHFFNWALYFFILIQLALLIRRVAISWKVGRIQPPPHLNKIWAFILGLALTSWILGAIAVLLPRLILPLLPAGIAQAFAFPAAVFGGLFVPYIWLLSDNLMGPSFFLLELLSIKKEGIFHSSV